MITAARDALRAAGIIESVVRRFRLGRAAEVDGSVPDIPELFIAVARHGLRDKPRQDGQPSEARTAHLVEHMAARIKR